MSNDCPSFLMVVVYLLTFIFAIFMMGYVLVWMDYWGISIPLLLTFPYFVAFSLIILNSCYNIYNMLFSIRAGQSSIQH
jgi:hypothetical protein